MKSPVSSPIIVLFCALATPALAGPVPAGTNEAYVSAGAGDGTHPFMSGSDHQYAPGLYVAPESNGTVASLATLKATNAPIPALDSLASITLGGPSTVGGGSAIAQGFTNYSFQVGGVGDTLLRINASGSVGFSSFQSGGSGSAHLIFRVSEVNNGPIIYDQAFFLDGSNLGCVDEANPHAYGACMLAFNVDNDFLIHANTLYNVHMDVTSSLLATSAVGGGTDTAFARIDPTFSVQAPFTIQLSDGFGGGASIGGGGPAPEPQGWALMLLGFAGLGAVARSRRRAQIWT